MTDIKGVPAELADDLFTRGRLQPVGYWAATGLVAALLLITGLQDLTSTKIVVTEVTHLGYPSYLLVILGIWKLLGAGALLVPRRPLLKEWAYAGTFFVFTGALGSDVYKNYGHFEIVLLVILIPLTIASWALRPAGRRTPRVGR
jgi:hypothetical protein